MSRHSRNHTPRTCPGPMAAVAGSRRSFMQMGLAGMASLSLPGLLRLQAERPLHAAEAKKGSKEKTAVIMVWQGSGPVRGFAVTLGLGILTSMFTAVYVTRLIVETYLDSKRPKTIVV